MEFDFSYFALFQYRFKIILHISRLNKIISRTCENIGVAVFSKIFQYINNIIRNRYSPDRILAFRRRYNYFCFSSSISWIIIADAQHCFIHAQNPFPNINVRPLQGTQLSNTNTCVKAKQNTEISVINVIFKVITEIFLFKKS